MNSTHKFASFKTKNGSLDVTRVGRAVYQHTDRATISHEYKSVANAKFALENARTSGNLISPDSLR